MIRPSSKEFPCSIATSGVKSEAPKGLLFRKEALHVAGCPERVKIDGNLQALSETQSALLGLALFPIGLNPPMPVNEPTRGPKIRS